MYKKFRRRPGRLLNALCTFSLRPVSMGILFRLVLLNSPYFSFMKTLISDITLIIYFTAQKMRFSVKDFFSKCDQIRSFLQIWSHLLNKSLMENFLLCAVSAVVHPRCLSRIFNQTTCNY